MPLAVLCVQPAFLAPPRLACLIRLRLSAAMAHACSVRILSPPYAPSTAALALLSVSAALLSAALLCTARPLHSIIIESHSLDRHVAAGRPHLVALFTVPSPLKHVPARRQRLGDPHLVDHLKIGQQRAVVGVARAAASARLGAIELVLFARFRLLAHRRERRPLRTSSIGMSTIVVARGSTEVVVRIFMPLCGSHV